MPTVVLVETLTEDHRRDHAVNQLLRTCQIRPVDEQPSRAAALLRTGTRRAGAISVTDALVAALAVAQPSALVLTSDPRDIAALTVDARSVVVVAT